MNVNGYPTVSAARLRPALRCSGAIVALTVASAAFAQAQGGPNAPAEQAVTSQPLANGVAGPAGTTAPPSDADVRAVEGDQNVSDIIVTARRREESLSKVPAAITAFNSEQLAERNIRTQSDLQLTVPGLVLRQTLGNNNLTYSLRGQTLDGFTGSPTAVVPYINEVQQNAGGAASFFDLDSIQVLKGPQGTLFGRNATGGAVLYTTAKPTDRLEGYIEGRVGNLNLWGAQGAINLPISDDKVLLRLAFDVLHRRGYIFNNYYSEYIGELSRQSIRASLTLKPTESLTNSTVVEYDHSGGSSTGASYFYSLYQFGETNNGFALSSAAQLYNPAVFDSVFGPGAFSTYLAANPRAFPGGINAYLAEQKRIGLYQSNAIGRSSHRGRDFFVTNTTTANLGENIQVKNIAGYSRSYARDDVPQTGEPYGLAQTSNLVTGKFGNLVKIEQLSNEIQLQGTTGDLTYIAGVYVQHTKSNILYPQTYFILEPLAPNTYVTSRFETKFRSEAFFAQGTYDLSSAIGVEGLRFTAGGRYTWEKVTLEQLPGSALFPAPRQRKSFSDPSWEAGFEWQMTPQLLTYAKTRGSFRAGGYNGVAPPIQLPGSQGGNLFGSEHTKDVEFGVKYFGRVMERPAQFNLALYNQWISDVQRVVFPLVNGNLIAVTFNIPRAEVTGFEADGSFKPADWLELGASGAYTNARYTGNKADLFGTTFVFGPYGDTPKWSGTLFGKIIVPASDDTGEISLRADTYGQTSQYFSNLANSVRPRTKLPGYALVNARLDWSNIMRSRFSAALFSKNVLKRGHFVGGLELGAFGTNAAVVGEPRTVGLELKYRF